MMQSPDVVAKAHERIKPYINHTPVLQSSLLNEWLGHTVLFKVEGFQKIGAFKIRGALNAVIALKERGELPDHIVTFSSGNHAQAVALTGKIFGIKTTIFMTKSVSNIKRQATESYGAEVILTDTRAEAEAQTAEMAAKGACFIHPFDHDDIIAGQGTACLEALQDDRHATAVFATCGGGGWLSGSYLATRYMKLDIPVFAAEPLNANDATRSYQSGEILHYEDSPKTIADGATSLSVSQRTFQYLQKLSGFYEVDEETIIYWSQWLSHLLKTTVEPTSATTMGAVTKWLATQSKPQRVLVLLSGGNIAPETYKRIWERNYLDCIPSLTTKRS